MGESATRASDREGALDRELQVAGVLFRCGCILEPGWRRRLRIPDQSADRALLHARVEPDTSPRAYRAVRCVRDAGTGTDALLPACIAASTEVERGDAEGIVLVHQSRAHLHGRVEHVPDRYHAGDGFHRAWHLVCAVC